MALEKLRSLAGLSLKDWNMGLPYALTAVSPPVLTAQGKMCQARSLSSWKCSICRPREVVLWT